ncbi:MAG: DtxR family transcriptional regulator [Armatimonadota bacterium]
MRSRGEIQLRVPEVCRPSAMRAGQITETIQEYVEGIYRLQQEVGRVATNEVAQYMGVSPASASIMLKRLAEMNLVEHTPYRGILLTQEGEQLAHQLLRIHRLTERLLTDIIGLPWNDVHDFACKLEHYIAPEIAEKIAEALGYPATCPHGNPIDPTVDDGSWRLSDAMAGKDLLVIKITDERREFLEYIEELQLVPGAQVEVLSRTPFDGLIQINVDGRQHTIGPEVARYVWVKELA